METEILEYICKSSEMGKSSLETTLRLIKDKDNKIKKPAEDILKKYQRFYLESKKLLNKTGEKAIKSSIMAKLGSNTGIKKEVSNDNSDAAIAGMIMQGLTMGVVETSVKIDNYKDKIDKKLLKLLTDFKDFQEDSIEKLKVFL